MQINNNISSMMYNMSIKKKRKTYQGTLHHKIYFGRKSTWIHQRTNRVGINYKLQTTIKS